MKFSIVTPSLNNEAFIRQTIESVLSQSGNFDIEYIIIDGGSTDKTVDIIKEYAARVHTGAYKKECNSLSLTWISEQDRGMYDALNKGFSRATGDVYAWINADDLYLPNAFASVQNILSTFPEIEWLKGISDFIDENSKPTTIGECYLHRRDWLQAGIYGRNSYHITQDSVFWKAHLWKKIGGIDPTLRYAGDYELWIKIAKYTPLWSANIALSSFRKRPGQLSKNIARYRGEQQKIMPQSILTHLFIRTFFNFESRFRSIQPLFLTLYRPLFMSKPIEYIEIQNNNPVKRVATSYIARRRKN